MSIYIDHIIMSSKMQKFGLLDSSVLFCIGSLVVSTMIVSYTMNAFGTEQLSVNALREVSKDNIYGTPRFIYFDNQSGNVSIGLLSFWKDSFDSCNSKFACAANFTTSWNNGTSFQLSTKNTNQTWSRIYGQPTDVKPNEQYQIVTHMKLNEQAIQSHMKLEGFNETSKLWYQITQCPSGINGPLEWQEFSCHITIPANTTELRPVLNAGWSSQAGQVATTWFDSLYLIKLEGPFIIDRNLKLEVVYKGLESPTAMAFLGPGDFLVVEEKKGTVERIVNSVKLQKPLLDVNVATSYGLVGIALQKNMSKSDFDPHKEDVYVFLYFTEADRDDDKALGNRLYRYELADNKLVNPKLLLNLPSGIMHNGGQIIIGPDKYVYITTGEAMNNTNLAHKRSEALNYQGKGAIAPDGRGGILRIDQNGEAILTNGHGILGEKDPLDKYYAYGIRNSYGLDFDPVTGNLWDTENGPSFGDEINLVKPGFNSGWRAVQGIWNVKGEAKGLVASESPNNLVDFNGRGIYSAPEFTWNNTVGPSTLKFLTTDKFGKQYQNDMFVADVNNGRIYHFKLAENRTTLNLHGSLADKVADSDKQLTNIVLAQGFGKITDLEIGPDGYLYVVSHDTGIIYKIIPDYKNEDVISFLDRVSKSTFSK
jgi:aldose sugar dehydrogenase